jgi:sugar lactone lactonase YvrE
MCSILKTVRPAGEILGREGTSKMKVKYKDWVSAAALIGIISISISSNPASAQQETSAFATPATFGLTTGIATDSTGSVYVANSHNTILKITHAGVVMTFAGKPDVRGNLDGVGSAADFVYPIGIATDRADNVYVTDKVSNTIRKITPNGAVTTLAGSAGVSGHADGSGASASFNSPIGLATDKEGNVYVADSGNNIIRKITPSGAVTTIAGLAGASGESDGIGKAARFTAPYSIAADSAGNLIVAEMSTHTLRKITSGGKVTTLAGKAGESGHADGVGTNATFYAPRGVATDREGNTYVADFGNSIIRKVTPAGEVTTFAGMASTGENGEFDGVGTSASFLKPVAIATGDDGDIFVLEADNIRKITPAGVVTTFVGAVFGPWHLQDQFCEWDVPPESGTAARSGTRRCFPSVGTTYCSSSIEVTNANPKNTKPKLSLVYDGATNVTAVDSKFKLDRVDKGAAKDDPPDAGSSTDSWLHYVVKITVSSTTSCK